MHSITTEPLRSTYSKCLWCSRNIHVSSALQNSIGPSAFEERQMNNQKRGMGDQTQVKLRWKKEKSEKAKQPLLCLAFEVLPLADIGIQTHTKAHRLSLLFLCFLSASLASPSFISSTSLHLYPFFAPGIPRVPPLLTTRLLWYQLTERSTAYFGSISPATTTLITATKTRLFNCTDSHLFVIHSHYHFPKALKHMHVELTSWFL